VGFQPDSRRGMGTANMQARAEEFEGSFDQVSRAGSGTSVRFSIPFLHDRPKSYLLPLACWSALLAFSLLVMLGDPQDSGPVVVLLAIGAGVWINRFIRARKQGVRAA